MSGLENQKKHARVLFRTTYAQYALFEDKSFSIPGETGPVELNDVINALMTTETKVYMNFFIGDTMIHESIEKTIEIACLSTEDIIEIYYSPRAQPKLVASVLHDDWIRSIAVFSDSLVLTGSYDFSVRMNFVDTQGPSTIAQAVPHKGAITDLCIIETENESSRFASASQDGSVVMHDYSKEHGISSKQSYFPHHSGVNSLKYSRKHETLFSGGNDGLVCMWSLDKRDSFSYFKGHQKAVTDIRVYENEILSGSMDGTIKVWNADTLQEISTMNTQHGIFCIDTKINDPLVLSGSANCTINLNDLRDGKSCFSVRGHTKWIYSAVFGEDMQFLSASEDKSLCLWDMRYFQTPVHRDQSLHTDAVLKIVHCKRQQYLSAGKDRRLAMSAFV